MKCALIECAGARYANGTASPFCVEHRGEFDASPEGRAPVRPSGPSDFRDRKWKEHNVSKAAAKWEAASPEQREEWKKGGFGR